MFTSRHPESDSKLIPDSRKIPEEGRKKYQKELLTYFLAGALCLLFSTIYNKFSHGVTSPYMTYLCLFPLLLGAVPSLIFLLFSFLSRPGFLSTNLYQTGLSAVTLSSAMRGIFEIAGTGSILQTILMDLGLLFLLSSIVVYIFQAIINKRHAKRLSKTKNK